MNDNTIILNENNQILSNNNNDSNNNNNNYINNINDITNEIHTPDTCFISNDLSIGLSNTGMHQFTPQRTFMLIFNFVLGFSFFRWFVCLWLTVNLTSLTEQCV